MLSSRFNSEYRHHRKISPDLIRVFKYKSEKLNAAVLENMKKRIGCNDVYDLPYRKREVCKIQISAAA